MMGTIAAEIIKSQELPVIREAPFYLTLRPSDLVFSCGMNCGY